MPELFDDEEAGDGIAGADPVLKMVRALNDMKNSQSEGQRRMWLLQAATALYPHIAVQYPTPGEVGAIAVGANITELDMARGRRAVDLAVEMEKEIQWKIDRIEDVKRRTEALRQQQEKYR